MLNRSSRWRGHLCPNVSTKLTSSTGAPVQQLEETWFCHVDDDNYLHTGNLLKMLSQHPTTGGKMFYLGKKSRPFWEIFDGRLSYKISKWIRSGQNVNRNNWVITFKSTKWNVSAISFIENSSSLKFCNLYRKTLRRFRTLASKPNKIFFCPRRGWFLYYSRQHPTDRRQLSTCVKVTRPGLQHWAEWWRHDWLLDGSPPQNRAYSNQRLPFSQRAIRRCQEEWFIQVGVYLAQLDAKKMKNKKCQFK